MVPLIWTPRSPAAPALTGATRLQGCRLHHPAAVAWGETRARRDANCGASHFSHASFRARLGVAVFAAEAVAARRHVSGRSHPLYAPVPFQPLWYLWNRIRSLWPMPGRFPRVHPLPDAPQLNARVPPIAPPHFHLVLPHFHLVLVA